MDSLRLFKSYNETFKLTLSKIDIPVVPLPRLFVDEDIYCTIIKFNKLLTT